IDDPTATVVVTVDGVDYPAVNNGDGTWTLADNILPVLADGPHTVSVTATDVAGNVSTPVTGTVTVDATAPTLAITTDDLALAAGEDANITFTFSEAVAGFDVSDITVVGGTLTGLTTTDNITWTAVFTPDGTAQHQALPWLMAATQMLWVTWVQAMYLTVQTALSLIL
ncbi:group 3 Ig-like protein, partial [Acinetobacter baumannii UH7907]